MDEENTADVPESDSVFQYAGDTTKSKKKAAPAKKKVDKDAETAKKPKKEIAAAKRDKNAASSKVNNEAGPSKAVKAAAPVEQKMSILEMVCEAIETLGDRKKGLSVQAIKKYVKGRQGRDFPGFNARVNKALNKGIEKGILVRPPASKGATGAVGFFRLAKMEPPKLIKQPRGKVDSEHASDSEAVEKPVKPRKRNLSDTYIAEMRASTPRPTEIPKGKIVAAKDTKKVKKVPKKNASEKKDPSDPKAVVKNMKRKPTKSYSSDTEVDLKKSKTTKSAKMPLKKADSAESKAGKAVSPSKVSKAKVKKLYKEEKPIKSAKTKAKKES